MNNVHSNSDGPDFIGIGLPKAGTGWLYDQLAAHPDCWMPPVKELVYLLQKYPKLQFIDESGRPKIPRGERAGRDAKTGRDRSQRDRLIQKPLRDMRDELFLKYASALRGKKRDLDLYAGLFEFKQGLISGDITPPYCGLNEDLIRGIAQRFPQTKIVLLLRDPVARAWSRICMSHEAGRFDTALLDRGKRLREYVENSAKLRGVLATETYLRWRSAAPDLSFRYFFFDDLVRAPEVFRAEVLQFVGADPKKNSDVPPEYNRKATPKLELTLTAKQVLAEFFYQELKSCADLFGGPASTWAAAYGL